jgi:large subunit ribosomal protein L23
MANAPKHNPAQYYALVRRPIVTEKSTTMQSLRNQFTFEVARSANKIEVKKAVETLFSVKVLKVNIVGVPSKKKRTFGRPGETKPWKKAVVTLRQGDSIDIS